VVVALGPEGSVWSLGPPDQAVTGGYPLRRWNGEKWKHFGGAAVGIAVDPDGRPWVVRSDYTIARWTGRAWEELPGRAVAVALGPEGSAWSLGPPEEAVDGGFPIHRWRGTAWEHVDGGAVRVSVGPGGRPWVVDSYQSLYRWDGRCDWQELPGCQATEVAVCADGTAWIVPLAQERPTAGSPADEPLWNGQLPIRESLDLPFSEGAAEKDFCRRRIHHLGNDTFCILAWKHLQLNRDGSGQICCLFEGLISKDGMPMSIHAQSLDEMWNSDDLRSIRRDMIQGRKISACEVCYRHEAAGIRSKRQQENLQWQVDLVQRREDSHRGDQQMVIAEIKQSVAQDYRAARPTDLELLLFDNLCNLKCRMCCGFSSSRIARDPVHSQWANEWIPTFSGSAWQQNQQFIQNDLLQSPERIRWLYFHGGEPLIIKEIGDVLQRLIDAGVASNIRLNCATNGSTVHSPWLRLAERFKELNLSFSIDGFGKYYEYIRYPARWDTLTRNMAFLTKGPNTVASASVTMQNYNLLNIVELFRYLDTIDLQNIGGGALASPAYLSPAALPPSVRRQAAERLRRYAENDCRPNNQAFVLGLGTGLEAAGETFDIDLLREFMLFTNDLDASRGQSFRETHAELVGLIEEAGFEWTAETRYAGRSGGHSLPMLHGGHRTICPGNKGDGQSTKWEQSPVRPREARARMWALLSDPGHAASFDHLGEAYAPLRRLVEQLAGREFADQVYAYKSMA
jgi:MoaA/NifB/PqqE/SkfB family radical SAM enzyme